MHLIEFKISVIAGKGSRLVVTHQFFLYSNVLFAIIQIYADKFINTPLYYYPIFEDIVYVPV